MSISVGGEDLGTSDPWEAITMLRAQRDEARARVESARRSEAAAIAGRRRAEDECDRLRVLLEWADARITVTGRGTMLIATADEYEEWRKSAGMGDGS